MDDSSTLLELDPNLLDAILASGIPIELIGVGDEPFFQAIGEEPRRSPLSGLAFDEHLRTCKAMTLCKALYNRYRRRVRHLWTRHVQLRSMIKDVNDVLFWNRFYDSDTDTYRLQGQPRPCLAREIHDRLKLRISKLSIEVTTQTVPAKTMIPAYKETVRDKTLEQEVVDIRPTLEVDTAFLTRRMASAGDDRLVDFETYLELDGMQMPMGNHQPEAYFPWIASVAFCESPLSRLVTADVSSDGDGRSGFFSGLACVPSLPEGPPQFTRFFWLPTLHKVTLVFQLSGGFVTLTGAVDQSTFDINATEQMEFWRDCFLNDVDWRSPPSILGYHDEVRVGDVYWHTIVFESAPLRPAFDL